MTILLAQVCLLIALVAHDVLQLRAQSPEVSLFHPYVTEVDESIPREHPP